MTLFEKITQQNSRMQCENCDYRKLLADVFDIHISEDDCWLKECEMEKGDEE